LSRRTKKEYIVLKQFWAVHLSQNKSMDIYPLIRPSPKIVEELNRVKASIFPQNMNYNFLHYRWEHDFTAHFRIQDIPSLDQLVQTVPFDEPELPIYVATTRLREQIKNPDTYNRIVYKDETRLTHLNFEERAFIDFMIGLDSIQVMGNKLSSFSVILNTLKETNHYYYMGMN
jgi:hypothetical protein